MNREKVFNTKKISQIFLKDPKVQTKRKTLGKLILFQQKFSRTNDFIIKYTYKQERRLLCTWPQWLSLAAKGDSMIPFFCP